MYSGGSDPQQIALHFEEPTLQLVCVFNGLFTESHLLRAGFPHSDIRGSKLVCQLPATFRKLLRPSSPVIAKASTTCTYSLDPITLSPGNSPQDPQLQEYFSRLCPALIPNSGTRASRYIQSLPCVDSHPNRKTIPRLRLKPRTVTLYFSRLLKNSRCTNQNWLASSPVKKPEPNKPTQDSLGYDLWILLTAIPPLLSTTRSSPHPLQT